jgi:hypothetical protein
VDCKASCHHSIHDLLKKAPDNHGFTFRIIASHKRSYQTTGCHATTETTLLNQNYADTFPGCSNGRTHTGRASAHNHNIGNEALINGSNIQLIHLKIPPVRNQQLLTLSR